MAKKQYLDLAGLEVYDEQIKAHIASIAEDNVCYVTVTPNDDITGGTVDKTIAQLAEAYNDGKVLICKLSVEGGNLLVPFYGEAFLNDTAMFGALFNHEYLLITILSEGVVIQRMELAQADQIPTKTSQLTNSDGFITTSVSNLVNYYNKSTVDGKDEAILASAKSYTDTAVSGKANSSHTHDDRYYTESEIDSKLSGKSDTGHTHNYAGSSSAGGAATSANKLNTNAGSTTQPVYFEDGIPKATTYTLGASVPSGAEFTDTVYTLPAATSSALGGVKSGGDVTISSTGVITVNDDSHNHTIANVDNLQSTLDSINEEIDGSISGLSVSGKTITYTKNDGSTEDIITQDTDTTYTISTGASNGQIKVTPSSGDAYNVNVKGLGSAAYTASTAYDAAGTAQTKADSALASAKTYTNEKINAIVGEGAAGTLDTIGEISAAIEENQDMLDTLNSAIGSKSAKTHTHTVSHTPAGGISETSITPAGTVSQPTFTGTAASHSHSFTGTEATLSADFTPAGTVSQPTFSGTAASHNHSFTGSAVTSGAPSATDTVASSTHTHEYTPAGTVSKPTFSGTAASHNHSFTGTEATISTDFTPVGTVSSTFSGTAASHNHSFTGSAVTSGAPSGTTTVYSITDVGTLPSCTYTAPSHSYTAPSLTASCTNRCLTLTFSAGSHSFNAGSHSFSAGKLPTKGSGVSVAKGDHTHSVTAAGTVDSKSITPAGTVTSTFTGTEAEIAIDYTPAGTVGSKSITPAGTVSQPTFTGTKASTTSISGTTSVAKSDHTHSVTAAGTVGSKSITPAGTVSQPTFTGTEAEIAIDYTPAGTVGSKSITPAGTVSQPTFTGTAATHKHTFTGTEVTLTTSAANS